MENLDDTFEIPLLDDANKVKKFTVKKKGNFYHVADGDNDIGELQLGQSGNSLHWFINSGENKSLLLEIGEKILPNDIFQYMKKLKSHLILKKGLSINKLSWNYNRIDSVDFIIKVTHEYESSKTAELLFEIIAAYSHKKNWPFEILKVSVVDQEEREIKNIEWWNI